MWSDLARMLKQRPDLKDKLPALINDILIALCGRRLGAIVYTTNEDDFARVQGYKRFRFAVI
jgi:predicted nucleic acid-binding protein